MNRFSLKALVSGLSFAVMTAGLLWILAVPAPVDPEVAAEEAQLFEEEFAEFFGEEPEIGTQLFLHQILPGSAPVVVIGRDGEELRFARGDAIVEPCLKLAEVFDDAVLLDDCGAYQLLKLNGESFETTVPRDGRSGQAAPMIADLRGQSAVTDLVGDYHQRLFRRPLSLRGQMDVVVKESTPGDKQILLFPGKDARLFSLLPLKNGDQLKAVNGIALDGGSALNSIYAELVDAPVLTLTLERNGRDMVMLMAMQASE
ncbi:hypothetical protein IB286_08230 [Spongiibacter sp. KMU-158]|uniref:Type II secretion system protein GspC N-terminal domain-containing protein n=1 Tax=Spongiibacter pelagi TaxID=2760804 RepID=A0A927C2J7_9GAMM|nr:hypothetical protein [Spongiibacter pelagi]MBD2858998.1 hypothetical protein [Spongiibacter pelagi]